MQVDGVAKILLVVVTCAVVFAGMLYFHRHCERKFAYRFFTWRPLVVLTLSVWALAAGGWAFSKHDESLEPLGWIFFAIGGMVLWLFLGRNFTRTGIVYGAAGSTLQVMLVFTVGTPLMFLALSWFGVAFVFLSVVAPIYVISRFRNT